MFVFSCLCHVCEFRVFLLIIVVYAVYLCIRVHAFRYFPGSLLGNLWELGWVEVRRFELYFAFRVSLMSFVLMIFLSLLRGFFFCQETLHGDWPGLVPKGRRVGSPRQPGRHERGELFGLYMHIVVIIVIYTQLVWILLSFVAVRALSLFVCLLLFFFFAFFVQFLHCLH